MALESQIRNLYPTVFRTDSIVNILKHRNNFLIASLIGINADEIHDRIVNRKKKLK